jgi:hypothetical protein
VNQALMLVTGLVFPMAAFALLLWLTHLEETLPRDVRAGMRRPEPPPILSMPVREPEPAVRTVRIPGQRGVETAVETTEDAGVPAD